MRLNRFSASRKSSSAQRFLLCQSKHQSGASLVEVLVSILIASIGLLALAGVNAASVRYTKMSQYSAQATLLANDIADRLRANRDGFMSDAYVYRMTWADQSGEPSLPAELCNTSSSLCTSSDLAALDMAQWRMLVRAQLPEGSVFVLRDGGVGSAADVWLAWRDPAVANNDERTALASECNTGLSVPVDTGVRCAYFRINL